MLQRYIKKNLCTKKHKKFFISLVLIKFSAFFFASSQLLCIFATLKYTEAVQSADPRSAFFVPQTIQVLTEYCTVSSIGDDSEVFAFV